ncbi:hypothetical protein [Tardiphaga robiniae]|uniref:hypothetical protein n=1 Tax=Tardiphaga robiniae TaxID=943830 RepID=UPI001586552B|nr:hypothetical protein [Tardiphaga robiniae]NUU42294.1 hypothetical protein [Tardiphaga robiniae]
MLEVFKAYPLAYVLLVAAPVIVGIFGALVGHENLATRLRNDKQIDRIEARQNDVATDVKHLRVPVETIRRYEAQLSAAGQDSEVLKRLLMQYDQLTSSITNWEKSIGRIDQAERIATAEHIVKEMQTVLRTTKLKPGPGGDLLIIQTGTNTFRVTFGVPMRVAPDLKFTDIPSGSTANVLEKTNLGFVVIFTPSNILVETLNFTASAEL